MTKTVALLTAVAIMNQSPQEEEANDMKYKLVDAQRDLERSIDKGNDEVSKLEREYPTKVRDYVLGGELQDLLDYKKSLKAKKADVATLEAMMVELFPQEAE